MQELNDIRYSFFIRSIESGDGTLQDIQNNLFCLVCTFSVSMPVHIIMIDDRSGVIERQLVEDRVR
jgi:hypothetical protein